MTENCTATVRQKAPEFSGDAYLSGNDAPVKISLADNCKNGKWTVLFFYPLDFTFV